MWRDERGPRQQPLPGAANLNQVVAVGAIAMQEHHELTRRAALARLEPRSVQFSRHGVSSSKPSRHANSAFARTDAGIQTLGSCEENIIWVPACAGTSGWGAVISVWRH